MTVALLELESRHYEIIVCFLSSRAGIAHGRCAQCQTTTGWFPNPQILYLDEVSTFDGYLSAEEGERLASMLTCPMLRVPLVLSFLAAGREQATETLPFAA